MATEQQHNEQDDMDFTSILIQTTDPVQFKISSDCYEKIMLPPLPTNFAMLMSNIDYPDKAKQNPNGSLFMQPSKEILDDKASDIGLQYFGDNLKWDAIQNYKTETLNDSYNNFFQLYHKNSVLNELLFGAGTDDLNNGIAGADINQETMQRTVQNPGTPFNGSPIDAIDKYVSNSIPVVEQLVRAIVGKDTSEIKKLVKLVSDFNMVNGSLVKKYIEKNNEVLRKLNDSDELENNKKVQQQSNALVYINIIRKWSVNNESYNKFSTTEIGKKFNDWLDESTDDTDGAIWNRGCMSFLKYIQIKNVPLGKQTDISNKVDQKDVTFGTSVKENVIYDNHNKLFEDNSEDAKLQLEQFNFDDIYNKVQSSIRDVMLNATMTDHEEWNIVKNAKSRMEKLKESCDKEINAKIELICRTVQSGQSSLGDKFKAAISKHPMRAEGLKNIWARYSDDLIDRIESRIRSIGGMNGNSNIFMTIKRFLIDTYPALIAMMITWKSVLELCKAYYDKYPKVTINVDQQKAAEVITEKAKANILKFYAGSDDNNNVPATPQQN